MELDILIDKLTPCIIDLSTGNVLQTVFSIVSEDDVSGLEEKGWLFDWTDGALHKTNIYKLLIKDDDEIQGLISAEVVRGAVYVHLAESAPHNRKPNKRFDGVGGHLFAIAMKLSLSNGFGGYIFMDAKNQELVDHYIKMLGARRVSTRFHPHRLEVAEENAQEVIGKYTLEGDLDVK